ncbi:MAG: hypothetical protein JXA21_12405 [Anaerolineae bacterium]|nr:hypothetical protein [Anaerolineae bacterium]
MASINLYSRTFSKAQVHEEPPGHWRLEIAGGPSGQYRGAQLDDYLHLPRRQFYWTAPVSLEIDARVSATELPGTWGFGFWNDPFNMSLGMGGAARRLPTLPNTAWFFYASPPNNLSLRDERPAQGLLAATFAAPSIPAPLLMPGALLLPLLAWPVTARLMRRVARQIIQEDFSCLDLDPTAWHRYRLDLTSGVVTFAVDESVCFTTPIAPRGRLGVVLWIDNQYMAFPPDGKLRFGTLASQTAWMELKAVTIQLSA